MHEQPVASGLTIERSPLSTPLNGIFTDVNPEAGPHGDPDTEGTGPWLTEKSGTNKGSHQSCEGPRVNGTRA